jgi:hypothetical protein
MAGMGNRIATLAILIWTGLMALGTFAAFLGIGQDCTGLAGSELSSCQADAWGRGGVGLALLVMLWLIVLIPMAFVWYATRPKEDVTRGSTPASQS